MKDLTMQTLLDYQLMLRIDGAHAIIYAVNNYGKDVNAMPEDIRTAVRMIATNCYWCGLFGETGQKCCRCPKANCPYRH